MRTKKQRNRVTFMAAVWLFAAFLSGCGYTVRDGVADYAEFLASYTKYAVDTDTPQVLPALDGFVPVTEQAFSFGAPFSGGCAFVQSAQGNALLSADGQLTPITADLRGKTAQNGYYVTHNNGKYGLLLADGTPFLPEIYDFVQTADRTVLAVRGTRAEVYVREQKYGEKTFAAEASVRLASAAYLSVDKIVCDLRFAPLYAGGYPFADVPQEGKAAVKVREGMLRYARLDTGDLLPGEYTQARLFSEGFAVAETQDGCTVVLDADGNRVYAAQDRSVGDRRDGWHCFAEHGTYGFLDASWAELPVRFDGVRGERAHGNIAIVHSGAAERLYDLAEGRYVSAQYERITCEDGLFVCHSTEGDRVYDENLRELAVCEAADSAEGILRIEIGGHCFYYRRATAKTTKESGRQRE